MTSQRSQNFHSHFTSVHRFTRRRQASKGARFYLPLITTAVIFAAFAICSLSLSPTAFAGEDDTGLWTTTTGTLKLRPNWTASLAVQTRSVDDASDLERTVLRPSISYQYAPQYKLTAGYDAHLIELPTDRIEHRAWQQWSSKWQFNPITLSARVRLEERFIEDVDDVAYRLRLGAMATVPLFDTSWRGVIRNEYFAGLNSVDGGPQSGFDQNRSFIGVSHKLNDHISAEVGYQLQHIDRGARADISIHQLMVNLSFR